MGSAVSSRQELGSRGAANAKERQEGSSCHSQSCRQRGAPFTLFYDQGFVAEKCQELLTANRIWADLDDAVDTDSDRALTEGDDAALEEISHEADIARIKLFSDPISTTAALASTRGASIEQALSIMTNHALERKSRATLATDKFVKQKAAIVREYFSQLAHIHDHNAAAFDATQVSQDSRKQKASCVSQRKSHMPPSSVFSIGSFRLQLEILREYREIHPRLFVNGVIAIIQTLMEMPKFVLASVDFEAPEAVHIEDIFRFCRDMMDLVDPNISTVERDCVLVLLLALGGCSGRISMLLEFVSAVLLPVSSETKCLQSSVCSQYVMPILKRMETFKIDRAIGTLEDNTLVKQFPVRIRAKDAAASMDEDSTSFGASVATDGSFLYVWVATQGLIKLGTGLNFTNAGRVHCEKPKDEFVRALQKRKQFRQVFYGNGKDATAHVSQKAKSLDDSSSQSMWIIRQMMLTGELEDVLSSFLNRKLFVEFVCGGIKGEWVFLDDDTFELPPAEWLNANGLDTVDDLPKGVVSFAFYGEFEYLSDKSIDILSGNDSGEGHASDKAIVLSHELLMDLLALSEVPGTVTSSDGQLIIRYSTHSEHIYEVEHLNIGDPIEVFYRMEGVHVSSLVYLQGFLYLHLLTLPDRSLRDHNSDRPPRRDPVQLIRVNPADLEIVDTVLLQYDEDSTPNSSRWVPSVSVFASDFKRLYEMELSSERFRIRVFETASQQSFHEARAVDLEIHQLRVDTFVAYLLRMLKLELNVAQRDCELPGFYTNGDSVCMLLRSAPTTFKLTSSSESEPSSSHSFVCVVFDLATGKVKHVEDEKSMELRRQSPQQSPSQLPVQLLANGSDCFERKPLGASLCYDAVNDMIWALDPLKEVVGMYRNHGRKLVVSLEDTSEVVLSASRTGEPNAVVTEVDPQLVAFRVLAFIQRTTTNRVAVLQKTVDVVTSPIWFVPFALDCEFAGFQALLRVLDHYAPCFGSPNASLKDLRCLEIILSVLNASIQLLTLNRVMSTGDIVQVLQTRLPPLLEDLLQQTSPMESKTEPFIEVKMEILDSVLELHATSMHIFHSDIEKQMSYVLKFLKVHQELSITKSETKILGRCLRHLALRFEDIDDELVRSSQFMDLFQRFIAHAVESEKKSLSALGTQEELPSMMNHQGPPFRESFLVDLVCLINSITQAFFLSFEKRKVSLTTIIHVFQLIMDSSDAICGWAAKLIQKSSQHAQTERMVVFEHFEPLLKDGFVGILSPMVFNCLLAFVVQCDEYFAEVCAADPVRGETDTPASEENQPKEQFLMFLQACLERFASILKCFDYLVACIDPKHREIVHTGFVVTRKSETMESAHEYANNLDVVTELSIPGASRLTITFDPRSRTEYTCDYVTFYKDESETDFYGEQYYSGGDHDSNWPGVGENPPLEIPSDHCFVYFHSDGSNTDWGYKLTAVGETIQEKKHTIQHWLVAVHESILVVLNECTKLLLRGHFVAALSELEQSNEKFLQSDLLRNGMDTRQSQNENVLQFLHEIVECRAESRAEHVVQMILARFNLPRAVTTSSSFSSPPQKGNDDVNRAVRAVAAAIFHHNMWGMDAYALAQDLRQDVSEQLIKGWKNAQKMRDWFHLGDAADASAHRPISPSRRKSHKLKRQPSAFKGLSPEALKVLCENVIERAKFLLTLTPASFSYVSGARRRWGLLAKYGSAIAKSSRHSSAATSPLEKWYQMLDELQAATELRSLFHYRRSSCERLKNVQRKSVTEQVLEFVQSDADVEELSKIIELRNKRAACCELGMTMFLSGLENCSSLRLKCVLVESFASTLKKEVLSSKVSKPSRSAALPLMTTKIHYDTNLDGCDGSRRQKLNEVFGDILSCFANILKSVPTPDASHSSLIISVLKACALDYELDDSYLLHDSRILSHMLRLLSFEDARVRRAAQSVIGVFLSQFVVGKVCAKAEAEDSQDNEATAFQKQLFAAVGLQLEGIVSMVSSRDVIDDKDRKWYFLAENSPGFTSPHTHRLTWNHSIMLWIYIPQETSIFTLKIGDEVRRGPDWRHGNLEDGGEGEAGIVIAIVSVSVVKVRWFATSCAAEYEFDPSKGRREIIPATEGLGGMVFFQGNKNLLRDTVNSTPWSYFGLYLNDQRHLLYRISCGAEKESVYQTSSPIECNSWTHVCVAQDEEYLRLYVNGLPVLETQLDAFLVLNEGITASESKIIESLHPCGEVVDQYWPVHIPGASKIRVTFDPLSEISRSNGFVRFYRSARCDEFWGEERYTGKKDDPQRNFPGLEKTPDTLEIPADRFLVYFHNEDTSLTWGFRLIASPEFDSIQRTLDSSLNAFPFYFGETPGRVLDERAAKCWVFEPKLTNFCISEDELVTEIQGSCPSNASKPMRVPNERILHVLGMVHTCCETPFGRNLVSSSENINNLLYLAFDEQVSIEARVASVRILRGLSEHLTAEILSSRFGNEHPCSRFVEFVFRQVSQALNLWSDSYEVREQRIKAHHISTMLELRLSAQGITSLVASYISLLHTLTGVAEYTPIIVQIVQKPFEDVSKWSASESSQPSWEEIGNVLAALALMGGSFDGLRLGGRVKCCVNIDGKESIETGFLTQFRLKNGTRLARILFDCDPSRPVDVPLSDVAQLKQTDELETFFASLAEYQSELRGIYMQLINLEGRAQIADRCRYKPRKSRKENVEVLESEHPYDGGEEIKYPLEFKGANEIVIYFDKKSCTAGPSDFIRFVRSSRLEDDGGANECEHWGEEKYYGDFFPGVGNTPPLRIPASAVDVHFHTESSSSHPSEWGFKLTAHAYEDSVTLPPEIPPSTFINALNDIRARSLKSLCCFFQMRKADIASFSPLLPALTRISIASSDARPTRATPKSQIFESKHPYANSVLEYMAVTFKGASCLYVSFDAKSRTEHGCDYLCFFKDKTLTDRWGAYQYSGADETANWPGVGGRPPLVIPSDSFTLLWCTDASNVDWGWKFTVTAEFPLVSPLALPLDNLEQRCCVLFEILYEKPQSQKSPSDADFEGFERVTDSEAVAARESRTTCGDDPLRKLLNDPRLTGQTIHHPAMKRKYRVVQASGVSVFPSRTLSATPLGHVELGDELFAEDNYDGWLRIKHNTADSTGWIPQRLNGKLCVSSVDEMNLEEELLVLGIDDVHMDVRHSVLEMDDSNPEHEELSNFFSQFSCEDLRGQTHRFQSLVYDSHRAFAVKLAQEATRTYLASAEKLSLVDFGSVDDFFTLLCLLFDQEKALERYDDGSDIINSIGQRLQEAFVQKEMSENQTRMDQIQQKCLRILSNAPFHLPKGRGAVRIVESAHPYPDNEDKYWRVCIPGAKRIKIVFDPRSKTETDCDFVCFYKEGTDRKQVLGEKQYGGRGGHENWPGCNGNPPLFIDNDRFEAFFHSDGSQNDWGFKFYAIGIFDPVDLDMESLPSSNEADSNVPLVEKNDLKSFMSLLRLCCWFLKVLAQAKKPTASHYQSLYSIEVLQVVLFGMQHLPRHLRIDILEIVTCMSNELRFFHLLPSNHVEEIRRVIKQKLRARYRAELCMDTKSHYLQTLAQCALALDLAIDSCTSCGGGATALLTKSEWLPLTRNTDVLGVTWLSDKAGESDIHQWQFQMSRVTSRVVVSLVSRSSKRVLVSWSTEGTLVCTVANSFAGKRTVENNIFMQGDLVSVECNRVHLYCAIRKNQQFVGFLLPPDSSPSLWSNDDLGVGVHFDPASDLILWRVDHTASYPMISSSPPIDPTWYSKLIESLALLLDFHHERFSRVVSRESSHPFAFNEELRQTETIRIPGAVALEVRFDRRTKMRDKHQILLFDSATVKDPRKNDATIVLTALSGEENDEMNPIFMQAAHRKGVVLRVGDQVVRAQDWHYGNEDGGPGTMGKVSEIVAWENRIGSGVRVKWPNGNVQVYRYGFDGKYDIQRCPNLLEQQFPLILMGDTLNFCVKSLEQGDSISSQEERYHGSLRVGKSGTLSVPTAACVVKLSDDFTIELWVLMDTVPPTQTDMVPPRTDDDNQIELLRLDDTIGLTSIVVLVTEQGSVDVILELRSGITYKKNDREISRLQQLDIGEKLQLTCGEWIHLAVVFAGSRVLIYENDRELPTLVLPTRKTINSALGRLQCGSGNALFNVNISNVRLWNVPFKAEQIKSHYKGLYTSLTNSLPSSVLGVSATTPPDLTQPSAKNKRWITINRTAHEPVSIRANTFVMVSPESSSASSKRVAFFEVTLLSSGSINVGWISKESQPLLSSQAVGDITTSFGIDLCRRRAIYNGKSSPLASATIFCHHGDVVGCALDIGESRMSFYYNGFLVATVAMQLEAHEQGNDSCGASATSTPGTNQQDMDHLVEEMLAMGFPRKGSTEALEASDKDLHSAVDWLLESSNRSSLSNSFVETQKLTADSHSPPTNSTLPSVVCDVVTDPTIVYAPAVSLDFRGAQGVVWNLGQNAFRFGPREVAHGSLTSVLEVAGITSEMVQLEIYDHEEKRWEVIKYRHRVQEIVPSMEGFWKLDEGKGTRVFDSTRNDRHGCVESVNANDLSEVIWDKQQIPPPSSVQMNKMRRARTFSEEFMAKHKENTYWGFRFVVIPHFTEFSIGRNRFETFATNHFCEHAHLFTAKHDHQLVSFVNKAALRKRMTMTQLLRASWSELAPTEDELVEWPALLEIVNETNRMSRRNRVSRGENESFTGILSAEEDSMARRTSNSSVLSNSGRRSNEGRHNSAAAAPSVPLIHCEALGRRFQLLQELNTYVHRVLALVPFCHLRQHQQNIESASLMLDPNASDLIWAFCRLQVLIPSQRSRIFEVVKRSFWEDSLLKTNEPGVSFELILNRPKAMRHRMMGKKDEDARFALFSQAFRQLNSLDGSHFRRKDNIYYVRFLGENAEDAGGPYRETFAQYVEEIQSTQLPLCLPTSNALHNVGKEREKWILNPSSINKTHLQMFDFVGKLFGVAIRSKQYLALSLANLIWKKLVFEKLDESRDLMDLDQMLVNSLHKMKTIDQYGVNEQMFEDIVMETFTTLSSDNQMVELKPDGKNMAVTFHNRLEFVELVEQYRLHECDRQIAAVFRGLCKVLPMKIAGLFTAKEFERLVCGDYEVDLTLLKKCTEYCGSVNEKDQHIVWFWRVLEEMSHEQRSAFLRFTWGRSRLPASEKDFPQWFKLQTFHKQLPNRPVLSSVDEYLPIAHTCFFSLELPVYSSEQILKEKLLYAIYNCQEIDADGDSMAANQLGWED